MLKVLRISKNYGTKIVFSDVSFGLEKGQKVALVGSNGIGKSTLLRILVSLEEADGGKVEINQGALVGYMPQDMGATGSGTILQYLIRTTNLTEDKLKHRAEVMMSGFSMDNVGLDRPLSDLSSGQKSKVALIGILLTGIDLLLLDEPTNNLDLPALIWLEDFLLKSDVACIIVSHDRRFLDRVTDRVFELDRQTHSLNVSNGSYSEYLERKAKDRSRQKEQYRQQQEEIGRLTEQAREKKAAATRGSRWQGSDNDKFLRGFKQDKASKSGKVAKALEKRIEQMDKVERVVDREPLSISLEAHSNGSPMDISLDQVVAGYPGRFEIRPISLAISYGNRVGFLGLNGSGKSTLLKTITGKLAPISGRVSIGSGLKIGNMMQEHETLPREETLLAFVKERTGRIDQEVFAALVKFGFVEKDIRGKISEISPGGRARLLLSLFSLLSVNALVLDEPTNHLDAEAVDALEEVLSSYEGTVILVSHDRDFLEKARIDFAYLIADNQLTKVDDFHQYIAMAEQKARKLLRTI
jgi:ATPase subunit of ABC transporter with duplicated ATPase domains